ncbi:MAG: laccase domain-containing protein, partial [bacterium]|nr:laccase domain-containing protein [bacterium]
MEFQIKKKKGLYYGTFPAFTRYGVSAAISFRKGGKSSGPYTSLNLGLHTEDNKKNVLKNRQMFFRLLDIAPRHVITLKQVHSNKVVTVRLKDRGKGAVAY